MQPGREAVAHRVGLIPPITALFTIRARGRHAFNLTTIWRGAFHLIAKDSAKDWQVLDRSGWQKYERRIRECTGRRGCWPRPAEDLTCPSGAGDQARAGDIRPSPLDRDPAVFV